MLSTRKHVEPQVGWFGDVNCPCGGLMFPEEFSMVVWHLMGKPRTQEGPRLLWYRCDQDPTHITGARPA